MSISTVRRFFFCLVVFSFWVCSWSLNAQEAAPAPVSAPTATEPGQPAAEAAPAAEAETAPVQRVDPHKGYGQLLHENVANRVGLSDAQKLEVQKIMTERSQALAGVAKEDIAAQEKIVAESDKKLSDLLTPEQRRIWPKVFEQKFIRFSFKYQNWEQVLRWFADQLGKQLVMEAPPPGTFDFSSQDEFTPTEALDLINSRLILSGYTLVHKDRTLMLFNLKRDKLLPQFLPQVNDSTIGERGNFDFVAYTLPLERRDVNVVQKEIAPFKGTYCNIIPMPGNSLLIIDSVANIKAIEKIAKAVSNPEPPQPPKPEPQSWKGYPIVKAEATEVESIITNFLKLSGYRSGNTLYYFATDKQHESLKGTIDLIESVSETRPKPVLEVYPMEGLIDTSPARLMYQARMSVYGFRTDPTADFGQALSELIKKMAPDSVIAPNQVSNSLIVFAYPEDHVKIKDLFEKLKSGPLPEFAPVVKVYTFKNLDQSVDLATSIRKTMSKLVPNATFSYDETKGQMIVVATSKEHELIGKTLEEIESQTLPDEDKILVMYPVTTTQQTRFTSLFAQVKSSPEFRDVLELNDSKTNQLSIWATSRQHEKIREILKQIANPGGFEEGTASAEAAPIDPATGKPVEGFATAAGNLKLGVFPLRNAYYYAVQQVIANMVPGAEVSSDYRTNSILVYGTPQTVESVGKVIEQMDSDLDKTVLFFPLQRELSDDIRNSFATLAPRATTVMDRKNMRLMVFGTKRDVGEIEKIISAENAAGIDSKDVIRTFTVRRNLPNDLLDFVRKMFPRSDIKFNADSKQVVVYGPEHEQDLIAKQVIEAETTLPPEEETKFYPLDRPVNDNLTTLIREATRKVGPIGEIRRDHDNPRLLIVRAIPLVQEQVAKALKNLDESLPTMGPNELRSFPITPEVRKRFDMIKDDFKRDHGEIKILDEDRKDILSVWGTPDQLNHIGELLEQLRKEVTPDMVEKRIIHTLQYVDFETVKTLLDDIYPGTKITEDKSGGRIIVRVRPEYYEPAKELIEQLDSRDPDQLRRSFKAYDVNGLYSWDTAGNSYHPIYFIRDLEKLVPNAKLSFDRYSQQVIVWGTPDEQKTIEEAIGNLQKDEDKTKQFDKFPLRRATPSTIIGMISRLYPYATVRYDSGTQSLIVEGGANQLRQIAALIEKLDPAEPGPTDPIVRFYKLKSKPETTLITTLRSLVPAAQIVPDDDAKQLMVVAKPDEHAIIEKNIKSIVETFTQPEEPMLFVYPVSGDQRKRLESFLDTARASSELRDVKVIADTTPGQVSIWARPSEHELISSILTQIQTNQDNELGLKIRVFSLAVLDPQTAQVVLQTSHPEAKLLPDSQKNRLIVWATEPNLLKVAATLKEIDSAIINETQPRFESFNIDGARFDRSGSRYTTITNIYQVLSTVVPNGKFFPSINYQRLVVWATPKELEVVRNALSKIGYSDTPEDQPIPKVFDFKTLDPATVEEMLKQTVPDVLITHDSGSGKIIAFGRPRDINAVEKLINDIETSNVDTRIPFNYEITETKSEIVLESLKQFFPSLKMTEDPKTNRIMVWATPEEHVKIGELVEQANKDSGGDMTEKFVAYPITRMYYYSATQILREVLPEASVYADPYSNKIIVKARKKEHKEIKELLESIQTKEDQYRVKFSVYPIGKAEPATIEAILQSLLRGARSMTPNDIKAQVQERRNFSGYVYDYSQSDYSVDPATVYNREGRSFYRVDASTQTAIVVAPEEDQKRVEEAIQSILKIAEGTGRPLAHFFTFNEVPLYTILPTLQQIAPASQIIQTATGYDFVVYGIESDIAKIAAFVKEVNDSGSSSAKREMMVINMPAGTRYSRERIISMLTYLYPASYSVAGPEPNQIITWNQAYLKDQIQKLIDEVCQPLPEGQQSVYKTYTINKTQIADAIRWLKVICPNATIEQDTSRVDPYSGIPISPQTLMILATPIEHAEIEKAISEIDKAVPEEERAYARLYTLQELFAYSYFYIFRNLAPGTRLVQTENINDFIVYGTQKDQQLIKNFVDELNDQGPSDSKRRFDVLTIPAGTRYSRATLVQLVAGFFPYLYPGLGGEPNQIMVFGKKYQNEQAQQLIDRACAQIPEEEQTKPKWYPVKHIPDTSAIAWLTPLFPNASITKDARGDNINGFGIMVVATPLEHLMIEKTLADLDVDVPERIRPMPRLYDINIVSQGYYSATYYAIYYTFPSPQIVSIIPDWVRGTLIITATESVHERIEKFLKDFEAKRDELKPYLATYSLSQLSYLNVAPILARIAPSASITQGATFDTFQVWALPQEQADIADAIQKLETAALEREKLEKEGRVPAFKLYRIPSKNATAVSSLLARQYPAAIIYPYSIDQVFVWASPSDQEQIGRSVGVFAEAFPEPYLKTYFFKHIPLREAYLSLTQMFLPGEAVFSMRTDTGDLLVQATEEYQAKVAKSIEHIDVPRPKDAEKYAQAYDLSDFYVNYQPYIISQVVSAIPTVVIFPSNLPSQMVVFCRQSEHEKVAQIVKEMIDKNPQRDYGMHMYTIKTAPATTAAPLIQNLTPNARFGYGTDRHQLLVYAHNADHEKIRQTVDALNQKDPDQSVPKVYRFQRATLASAYQVISMYYPSVEISYDSYADFLLIKAIPEEHEEIAKIAKELDAEDPQTQTSLQIHRTGSVDATKLYSALAILNTRNPRFLLMPDVSNKTLTAVATPEQHRFIDELITQIQSGGLADPNLEMKFYTIKYQQYYYTVEPLIRDVFADKGIDIDLSYDYYSDTMVIFARPEEQTIVQQILDSLKTAEQYVQVFAIQTLDLESIPMIIYQLFQDESYTQRPNVSTDYDANKVIARGTLEQLEQIRNMLIQMGETQLLREPFNPIPAGGSKSKTPGPGAAMPGTNGSFSDAVPAEETGILSEQSGPVRTFRVQGDVDEALKELEKKWPHIRGNELMIREQGKPLIQERKPEVSPGTTPPSEPKKDGSSKRDEEKTGSEEAGAFPFGPGATASLFFQVEKDDVASKRANPASQSGEGGVAPSRLSGYPDIYLLKNDDGTITIMSSDKDALNDVELQLKQLTSLSRVVLEGRDYTIYSVRKISATVIYQGLLTMLRDKLNPALRRGGRGYYYGYGGMGQRKQLELTVDPSMNTITARGSKSDREEVGRFIEVLEASQLEKTANVLKPINVPVENVAATEILRQVLAVFQQRLYMTPLPGGGYPRVVLNTTSNSLDIFAPEPLASDLKEYIKELDEKAPTQQVQKIHVLRPSTTNSSTIKEAIDAIQRSSALKYMMSNPGYMYQPYPYYPTYPMPRY